MSPMVTITRDLDNLVKESGADKINLAYSTAEYDESFENIKFGLIASSMQKAKYNGCSFENCEFSGLNMKHAKFDDAEFIDCDFGLAQLDGVTAQNSSFYGDDVYFTGASMVHADFSRSSFACAGFNGVNASWAYFVKSDLRKADFSGANLFGVSLCVLIFVAQTLLVLIFVVLSSTEPSWMAGPSSKAGTSWTAGLSYLQSIKTNSVGSAGLGYCFYQHLLVDIISNSRTVLAGACDLRG